MSNILLSTHDAARSLGIGRTKLFELLRHDCLAAVRLGNKTLIPVAELERFAASLPARNGAQHVTEAFTCGARHCERGGPRAGHRDGLVGATGQEEGRP